MSTLPACAAYEVVVARVPGTDKQRHQWCIDNFGEAGETTWTMHYGWFTDGILIDRFYFADEQMAILFTLRWK